MTEQNLDNFLSVAKAAAKQAGDFLSTYSHDKLSITKEEGKDIKISADTEAEKIIMDKLRETGISILSEEHGWEKNGSDDLVWLVDPLDGSLNFSRQSPLCCVSIGLWQGNEPRLGVVYDFNRDELFSGIVGQGAWLNDQPIKVSAITDFSRAIVTTGFPSHSDYDDQALLTFVKKVQTFKKVRLLGSAALSLAYVASGRADAYTERDINRWDIAGGAAVVLAAGGHIEYMKDTKKNAVDIMVSNGRLNF